MEELLEQVGRHTSQILLDIANPSMPNSIKKKIRISSNYNKKRLPILDMVMWVDNNTIHHNHYSKPMSSKHSSLNALPAQQRITKYPGAQSEVPGYGDQHVRGQVPEKPEKPHEEGEG